MGNVWVSFDVRDLSDISWYIRIITSLITFCQPFSISNIKIREKKNLLPGNRNYTMIPANDFLFFLWSSYFDLFYFCFNFYQSNEWWKRYYYNNQGVRKSYIPKVHKRLRGMQCSKWWFTFVYLNLSSRNPKGHWDCPTRTYLEWPGPTAL